MALHSRGIPSAVLAAGAHLAVVLSEHGKELDRLELPVSEQHLAIQTQAWQAADALHAPCTPPV